MGGAQNLPKIMADPPLPADQSASNNAANSLRKLEVEYNTKVTKIAYDWKADPEWILPAVEVTCKGEDTARKYDAVFNSTTLGIQQQMSLEGLRLNWGTKQAIRSLGYGASTKVGIRFKSLWWMKESIELKNGAKINLNIKGGIGHTDESIGFCVYPSYNIEDPKDGSGVLLASYNWSQAAQRLSGLIDRDSPKNEERLREVLLEDLARLHAPASQYDAMYAFINDQYLDHYGYSWDHSEHSLGAFAFFGPGQFRYMWPWIIRSNGTYMMIGEAASSRHAWVAGALESAVRAVYQFLWVRSRTSYACSEAAKLFVRKQTPPPGPSNPELSDLFLELPAEFNRTDDIKAAGSTAESSPIGEFLRQGIFAEVCRLLQDQDQLSPEGVALDMIKKVLPAKYVSSGTQT